MRTAILLVLIFGSAIAQEDGSILNVRQIMKDTFDIIRNAPPLPGFNEVSKIILSTTQVPPVRQYVPTNPPPQQIPPLTYDQIQMLRQQSAQQRSVNAQQMSPQEQMQRWQQIQAQYRLMQMQQQQQQLQQPIQRQGQVVYGPQANYGQAGRYGPVPQQAVQQPQPILAPLARIFATPTEKDVERLLRLPTEILYKMAREGQYIEPERNQYSDSRSSEYDHSSSSGSGSGSSGFGSSDSGATPDAAGGLFGNGFSFNLQGNGDNMGMPVTPPTELQSATPEPIQTTTVSASTVSTILAMADNATLDNIPKFTFNESHINKPYFTYRTYENPKNDHWELIVPNTEGKPSVRMPMAEVLRLSKIVAKANYKAGMPVGAPTELEGFGQINPDLFTSPATEAPVTTAATTQAAPVLSPKQEQPSPASAFVQESESPKIQKPDESPSGPSGSSPLYAGQEIILNGKRYKLVDDDGNVNAGVLAAAAKAEELKRQAAPAPPPTLPPVPVRNQPALPALMSSQPQPQQVQQQQPIYPALTAEQESILMEIQNRVLRQQLSRQQLELQQAMAAVQPQPQPGAQPAPAFVMTEPPAALPTDPNQSYYGKVQVPSESSQQIIQQQTNNIQQPYQLPQQAVISEQQQHALAAVNAPVQIVKPQPSAETAPPVLPMKNQYSLAELEEYYKIHNANTQAETTTTSAPIEVTTTTSEPAHVYAPHKQIKIQVNNTQTSAPAEVSETQIVDATADAADQEKQRVADLRRQFAVERRHLNRLNKSKIERTTGLEATTPASQLITEQHCYNIRNFARQYGFHNTYKYAETHCHFIENYYPDLKCDNVKDYMQICQQYYSTRRLLFTA